MKKADCVVSARFHGLVMAAMLGRPFMGVGDSGCAFAAPGATDRPAAV
jgi:hypothetical protein